MYNCNDSVYKLFTEGNYNHIIIGNLNIISHLNLRKLMECGTKFRLPSC